MRAKNQITGTRWTWMNDSVFHARRRVFISGYEFDLVLNKKSISGLAYDENWYLSIEDPNSKESVVKPIILGAMVARDAVRMAEGIVRSLVNGNSTF